MIGVAEGDPRPGGELRLAEPGALRRAGQPVAAVVATGRAEPRHPATGKANGVSGIGTGLLAATWPSHNTGRRDEGGIAVRVAAPPAAEEPPVSSAPPDSVSHGQPAPPAPPPATKPKPAREPITRDLTKTISFLILHLLVGFTVAYIFTGSLAIAGGIALVEPVVNAFVFFFHERAWRRTDVPLLDILTHRHSHKEA